MAWGSAIGPRQVQYSAAVPAANDKRGYCDGQVVVASWLYQEEPSLGQGTRDDAKDRRESRDPGIVVVRVSIPHPDLPSCKDTCRWLDLSSTRCCGINASSFLLYYFLLKVVLFLFHSLSSPFSFSFPLSFLFLFRVSPSLRLPIWLPPFPSHTHTFFTLLPRSAVTSTLLPPFFFVYRNRKTWNVKMENREESTDRSIHFRMI